MNERTARVIINTDVGVDGVSGRSTDRAQIVFDDVMAEIRRNGCLINKMTVTLDVTRAPDIPFKESSGLIAQIDWGDFKRIIPASSAGLLEERVDWYKKPSMFLKHFAVEKESIKNSEFRSFTSALLNLFIQEHGEDKVRECINLSKAVSMSGAKVDWVELNYLCKHLGYPYEVRKADTYYFIKEIN